MLATAAGAQSNAYLAARQSILNASKELLPMLAMATSDRKLTWQQRLVARISYERNARSNDIESIRRYNWKTDPQYDKKWEHNILGVEVNIGTIIVPKCVELGLWYYFVEMTWKRTGEDIITPWDSRMQGVLAGSGRRALEKQPERYYLIKTIMDRLEQDTEMKDIEDILFYRWFFDSKDADAMPVLIQRHAAFFKQSILLPAGNYYDDKPEVYRNSFELLMEFADSRHADLIGKFIAEHPALAPLKDKVAEIRKRPAPPPLVEPPFRLGQNLVSP